MPSSHRPLQLLVIFFWALTAALAIGAALAGTPFYRDQHLGTALLYAKSGIDLWHPVIIGFTATGTPTVQELPLWQALTSMALRLSGGWWGSGSIVSILCTASALWPLYRTVNHVAGARRAWWTLVFFSAQPLLIVWSATAGTDGFAIASSLWFFWAAERLIATGSWKYLVAAVVLGALAALQKAPFFLAYGAAAAVWLLFSPQRANRLAWGGLVGVGGVAMVVFFLWMQHVNAELGRAEFPFVELRLSKNPDQIFWWFGDLAYRLNPFVWGKAGWRILNGLFGSFALVGLAIVGLFASRSRLAMAWLGGALLATLIFTHVILHHQHYFLMLCAPCALLCAEAAVWLEERFPAGSPLAGWGRSLVAGAVLFLSSVQGVMGLDIALAFDRYPARIAQQIAAHTAPGDRLLIQNGGWGQILMLADRSGLSIWDTQFLEQPENLQRLRELGYNKLVMVSESPLLLACQKSDPGNQDLPRETWKQRVTPIANGWPTEVETEDLLIKSIPAK
jgi:hypothetical protein